MEPLARGSGQIAGRRPLPAGRKPDLETTPGKPQRARPRRQLGDVGPADRDTYERHLARERDSGALPRRAEHGGHQGGGDVAVTQRGHRRGGRLRRRRGRQGIAGRGAMDEIEDGRDAGQPIGAAFDQRPGMRDETGMAGEGQRDGMQRAPADAVRALLGGEVCAYEQPLVEPQFAQR